MNLFFVPLAIELEMKTDLQDDQHSPDIGSIDGYHRRRSNTQQRLDKYKRDRYKQAKTKVYTWQETKPDLTGKSLTCIFMCRAFSPSLNLRRKLESSYYRMTF